MPSTKSPPKIIPYEEGMAPFRAAWSPGVKAYAAELAEELDFATRLRAVRKALGLTQQQVEAITGEDQADISRMERGRLNPTVARARRTLAALGAFADEQAPGPSLVSGRPMTAVMTAAHYLLAVQDEEDGISGLKLQKLLYYGQGYSLAVALQPLFGARIKAWANGPVIPDVWHAYKAHQSDPIPRPDDFDPFSVDARARAILDRVYAEYGQFTAWRLREMTHSERPWQETVTPDDPSPEITTELLRDFFGERLSSSGALPT